MYHLPPKFPQDALWRYHINETGPASLHSAAGDGTAFSSGSLLRENRWDDKFQSCKNDEYEMITVFLAVACTEYILHGPRRARKVLMVLK